MFLRVVLDSKGKDALEHYIDSHTTLWSLLLGGKTYEKRQTV